MLDKKYKYVIIAVLGWAIGMLGLLLNKNVSEVLGFIVSLIGIAIIFYAVINGNLHLFRMMKKSKKDNSG